MALPNVPTAMPQATFDANMTRLDEVLADFAQYGFNGTLTDDQISQLSVPGDRMTQFVRNSHQAATDFTGSIPPDFPTAEFQAAYLTFDQASQLEARLEQLRLGAHTTAMLAGSSAKGFADTLYGLFQSVAKFNATIKAFVEAKLAPFYARHGNRHDNPKP